MKKSNLKEIITIIKQNIENEDVLMDIANLPNHKIKPIIVGNKKVIQPILVIRKLFSQRTNLV